MKQSLLPILDELNLSSADILSSALMSADGLPLVTHFSAQSTADEEHMGAMSAALLALGKRGADELGCGPLKQVIVEGGSGFIVLVEADRNCVLMIHARQEAKLGLILVHARKAVSGINRFLH